MASAAVLLTTSLICPASHAQNSPISPVKGITPIKVVDGSASLISPADPNQMLRIVIALNPPKLAEEQKLVDEITTKGNPNFHKFLSPEQWNKRFAPAASDEQAVVDWATHNGLTITQRYANRLIIDAEAPVSKIQEAFGIKINKYAIGNSTYFSNDRDPVLPGNLIGIIGTVQGLNNIQVLHPLGRKGVTPNYPSYVAGPVVGKAIEGKQNGAGAGNSAHSNKGVSPNITGGAYDPSDIWSSEAYDVDALMAQGHCCNPLGNSGGTPKETSIAVATAGSQDPNDFAGFHNQYPYLAYHWYMVGIDGESVPCNPATTSCDGEGTMDFEWSTAMSNSRGSYQDTSSVVMYDGVNAGFGTFTDIYNRILSDNSTRIMTTSWGCEETACYDNADMQAADNIFVQMVGEGWTLVAASGDQGATAGCGPALAVQFPSSDPHVIAAGGATLQLFSDGTFDSNVAWSGGPYGCGSNDGGSTGGVSSYFGVPGYQSGLGYGSRAVPDLALNADWYHTPQNLYYDGYLSGNGGTSIVAPELAGIFAQENAYLLTLGNNCLNEGGPCAPMGDPHYIIYYNAENPGYAPHYPFYDITSGCNDNDVTASYGLGYYCAVTGYDAVTGWGSFNALQLAWSTNTYMAGDFGAPVVTYSGPATGHWYNTDQTVSWTVADTSGLPGYAPNGVAGFSQNWDLDPGDVTSESNPGAGNSFYSGPQFPNATSGSLDLASAGQGCHTANVRAWDNSGFGSGDKTYGSVCYDITPPTISGTLSGTPIRTGVYVGAVNITLKGTDTLSGLASFSYKIDSGSFFTKSGTSAYFSVSTPGSHTVSFYDTDVAGNHSTTSSLSFLIEAPTTTSIASSANPSVLGEAITISTLVSGANGAPTGTVQLKSGTTVLQTGTLSAGKASFTISTLPVGTTSLVVAYLGDANHLASTSPVLSQVVNASKSTSSTAISSSANPSTHGQTVTFTGTVTSPKGIPTGTVQLKQGTTTIGSATLASGKVFIHTSSLPVGTSKMTFVYLGDATHTGSTSPILSQVVH
jgi:hypothetical protein